MNNRNNPIFNSIILITGGTGSFGQAFTNYLLNNCTPKAVRIFSRDELKQLEMANRFAKYEKKLRFFIGDVRDKDRLLRAFENIDIVIHSAALKQVPSCEYNPMETIKTNILGSQNVIEAALDRNVNKVILISSDKAVQPLNTYGATKLCAEKLFIQSNVYRGIKQTKFSVVRYGNVLGSRGSVLPLFRSQIKDNQFTITNKDMTRFWMTLTQACKFVTFCIKKMTGGEIFVPKAKSLKIIDLAYALNPKAKIKYIGIRPGEKINEILITEDEARRTAEYPKFFVIQPEYEFWKKVKKRSKISYSHYSSNNNKEWLTSSEIKKLIDEK